MIGARKETLGKTRSETKALSSPTNESMERADLTMEDWIQETCLISAVTSGPTKPKTFPEPWHYPIEDDKERWRLAIRKEIRSMIERGVWRMTDRKKIPSNRRLIRNKWVFKIKRDGTYRASLVALGCSQIPGVDYKDNFAPVSHDVSFRIALAKMMVEKLDSLVMDVEAAFLYGDIEEEIFMQSPVGMEEIDPGSSSEDCYQLRKGIYGLCQAARQFWKKFVDTIKKEPFGFTVRGILSNQKSVHTTHTTCTTRLRSLSSHAFYHFVERVVHRVNAPRAPPNECEPWREVGGSSQIN